jgi:hypothetical protein
LKKEYKNPRKIVVERTKKQTKLTFHNIEIEDVELWNVNR